MAVEGGRGQERCGPFSSAGDHYRVGGICIVDRNGTHIEVLAQGGVIGKTSNPGEGSVCDIEGGVG